MKQSKLQSRHLCRDSLLALFSVEFQQITDKVVTVPVWTVDVEGRHAKSKSRARGFAVQSGEGPSCSQAGQGWPRLKRTSIVAPLTRPPEGFRKSVLPECRLQILSLCMPWSNKSLAAVAVGECGRDVTRATKSKL
eukprot:1367013-Amphidinium_carterae.2